MAFVLNTTVSGLRTLSVGIPIAGPLEVAGTLTLPSIPAGSGAQSQVVVTITQTPSGGSPTTIYTGLPGARGFKIPVTCAANDTISITTSSGATVDTTLDAVRMTASIG